MNPDCPLCGQKLCQTSWGTSMYCPNYECAYTSPPHPTTVFGSARCEHRWLWSGFSRTGQVWCSKCNIDYDKDKHGPIPDLAEMISR